MLVSLRGEVADVVTTSGIGMSYNGGHPTDLLNKLLAITSDIGRLRAMSEASRGVGMRFDKNVQYRKFIDVIDRVTGHRTETH